jgi:hypothetical protein
MERFTERMARLYEQGADARRIGQYVERWWRWAQAGVTLTDEAKMACPVLLPAIERRGGAGHHASAGGNPERLP